MRKESEDEELKRALQNERSTQERHKLRQRLWQVCQHGSSQSGAARIPR